MRTVIVMTYFNRQDQLTRTLESFRQYDPNDFCVIVVDDGSKEVPAVQNYPFDVKVLNVKNKSWYQGDPAWNIGFAEALKLNPDTIILQNAECYHAGDILEYAKEHLTDENYISFGCYSLGKGDPFEVRNNRHITFDGENAWYNHPEYWPCGYHFCSAIKAKHLKTLNGFDERLSFGMGYDDDDFLRRVKLLGLKVEITADPFVYHQWHYGERLPNYQELLRNNAFLYGRI